MMKIMVINIPPHKAVMRKAKKVIEGQAFK